MELQAKKIDEHPVSWLGFEEDAIITSCKNGEFGAIEFFLSPPWLGYTMSTR